MVSTDCPGSGKHARKAAQRARRKLACGTRGDRFAGAGRRLMGNELRTVADVGRSATGSITGRRRITSRSSRRPNRCAIGVPSALSRSGAA